jgi:hypothetical protein
MGKAITRDAHAVVAKGAGDGERKEDDLGERASALGSE